MPPYLPTTASPQSSPSSTSITNTTGDNNHKSNKDNGSHNIMDIHSRNRSMNNNNSNNNNNYNTLMNKNDYNKKESSTSTINNLNKNKNPNDAGQRIIRNNQHKNIKNIQNNNEEQQNNNDNDNMVSTYNNSQMIMGNNGFSMGYGLGGMGMGMGMGFGGYGGGYGGYGISPYGFGMGMMGGGPLQGLNQLLFSFQTVVFSLGQAMQVLGMNTQALNQLYHQAIAMIDQALYTLNELKTLETNDNGKLSEDEKKKRRRLKAIRWSIMFGISYVGYSMLRKWLRKRRFYKEYAARASGNSQHIYNNNNNQYSLYPINEGRARALSPYGDGTGIDDYYSRSTRHNNRLGHYGSTYYDYQGYQPSYYPEQSYHSRW